ncbi:MAG TPA: 4Fe-4S binding protein [Gammaproteobacteria bacterium]|nr:4Fe-4S binding protein [Gammaproteobacteria bacterium]
MKANESLSKIPVVVSASPFRGQRLDRLRRFSKYGTIIVLALIPILGIFRIDVSSGFVVLDRQIWFSDFNIVFGFWLALACCAILFYSTVGTAFCGWVCPQNTSSSLMDDLTKKLLGKRAVVDWENLNTKIAGKKNKLINWLLLMAGVLVTALFMAFLPLMYFIPPDAIWAFVTFSQTESFSSSLYWIYTVFVLIAAVNLAVVRHYVCRFMCIYRIWQYLFKTSDSLHIDYDETRKLECEKCNYCVKACMVDIDPRNIGTYDSCTNCGACIAACDELHAKKNELGLLKFGFGARRNKEVLAQHSIATFRERSRWVVGVMLLGVSLFVYGLLDYDAYHLAVYKSDKDQGSQIHEYRASLSNKIYHPAEVKISVEGLNPGEYQLSSDKISFASVGRGDVFINLSSTLSPGLHSFIVHAESDDGWKDEVRIQHYVGNG